MKHDMLEGPCSCGAWHHPESGHIVPATAYTPVESRVRGLLRGTWPRLPWVKVRFLAAWYDLWVGAFWDSEKRRLYILPIPCLGIVLEFPRRASQ